MFLDNGSHESAEHECARHAVVRWAVGEAAIMSVGRPGRSMRLLPLYVLDTHLATSKRCV